MRLAVIDLGTNTFNLLIGETGKEFTFKKIFNTKISVKLGEGSINDGYIADVPFQRGLNALKQYQTYLLEYGVEKVYAFATSAIRTAKNGNDFIQQAKEKAGIHIELIDGNQEADFIYEGVKMAINMGSKTSLIFDIGGGSNELILANADKVFWKQSFLLGVARLLAKFKISDPVTENEIEAVNLYLKQEFSPLFDALKKYPTNELIGSSGVFDSVIDMIAEEFGTERTNDDVNEYVIDIDKYRFISHKVKKSTYTERQNIKGLIEMRMDMIVISFLLLDFIINECKITVFKSSAFSLKEGAIGVILKAD